MVRNRFVLLAATLVTASVLGCQQHYFMTQGDLAHYRQQALTHETPLVELPDEEGLDLQREKFTVRNVLHPDGKPRPISLVECIALALENGRTGDFFDRLASRRSILNGLINAGLASPSNATDAVRVLAYDPAIRAVDMEISLSKNDAIWQSGMTWQKQDEPRNVLFGLRNVENTDASTGQFQTQLLKPLPTGGTAGITFRNNYELSNINERFGRLNPAYTPNLDFSLEQPLLRGAGVGINQLLEAHPGSTLTPFRVSSRAQGIVLTRLGYDQQQLEFERRIHDLVFVVEEAYWQLYGAYWDLYSRSTALLQAHAAWQVANDRFQVGKISGQEFYQIQEQFHNFRAQRLQALGNGLGRAGVLEAERNLRYLIGLPPEDGDKLIPSDVPTTAPVRPDYAAAIREGLARRPELQQIRLDLRAAQLAVLREKDNLLPDLRFLGRYNVNALGSHLDGEDENNALRNLMENAHNNWELGLRLEMTLGFRDAYANIRRARLQAAQRVAYLQDQEQKLAFSINRSYRSIIQLHEEIRIQQNRRESAAETLRLRFQEFDSGKGTVDTLLEAQRSFADALREEQFAIVDYNIALIDFERQKGTILDYDNVRIVDGPLPACVVAKASEHVRERERSLRVSCLEKGQCTLPLAPLAPVTPAAAAEESPIKPVALEVPDGDEPLVKPATELVPANDAAKALPERLPMPEGLRPAGWPRRSAAPAKPIRPPFSILPPEE